MSNEDKMLRLVLSDSNLSTFFGFNSNDFTNVDDALQAKNPVVVVVAKIIRSINSKADKNKQKQVYQELFNYLNGNIL